MTDERLVEIEARWHTSKLFTCDDPDFICPFPADISVLIAALREERGEKEHLRRALEWLADAGGSAFCHASGIHIPKDKEGWQGQLADIALDATKEPRP